MNDPSSAPDDPAGGPAPAAQPPEVESTSSLWKLLWDYDPNGLLVLDEQMTVRLVNPAFCRMVRGEAAGLVGRAAAGIIGDITEFRAALRTGQRRVGIERLYPQFELFVRKLIFPIPNERLVAGIFVDLTTEWKQQQELEKLKEEAIQEVRRVVDKQMNVAQNIAGLLGETTAETKVSLLRLLEMLRKEDA